MTDQDSRASQSADAEDTAASAARPGGFGRLLRWTGIAVGGSLVVVVLGVSIFVGFGIPVDLSGLRDRIEGAASDALGRGVAIEGPIELIPTLWPTLQVETIRVGNPEGWPDDDFVRLDLARAQLGILSLLGGDLQIRQVAIEGLTANLETDAAGKANWLPKDPGTAEVPWEASEQTALRFVELGALRLTDITVSYRSAESETPHLLELEAVTGKAEQAQPMALQGKGTIHGVPYLVALTGGSLATLLDGEAAWPLEVTAEAAGTTLTVAGEIGEPLRGKGLALDFDLDVPDTSRLEAVLGTKLRPMDSIGLRGRITETDGAYRVTDLEGDLGGTAFSGDLEVDGSAARPRLKGSIRVPSIDARLLTAAVESVERSETEEVAPDNAKRESEAVSAPDAGEPIDPDEPILALTPLQTFDADFALTIREVVGAPISVADASLSVSVRDGRLIAPVKAIIAEVPFAGEVRLEPQDGKPSVSAALSAEESDIGKLLSLLTRAEGVEGAFQSAELSISAGGDTIRSLVESTELRFALTGAALSYGHDPGERPVEFTLERYEMLFPAAGQSRITAEGTLLREAFSLELSGGSFIDNFINDSWPIDLTATGGGARLRLNGTVRTAAQDSGSNLEFSLDGKRIGGLSRWLGVSPDKRTPYALRGAVKLTDGAAQARIREGRIGNTAFTGQLGIRDQGGRPLSLLELAFDLIDPEKLAGLFPKGGPKETSDTADEAFSIELPILPTAIALDDSDIDVKIARIKADPRDITEVSVSSRIRNGHVANAPLRAVVAGAALEGHLSADLRGDVPTFDFGLQSREVDVGDLLAQLGIVQDLDFTAGHLDLSLALRGASLRGILEQSEFSAGIRAGSLRLQDANSDGSLDIGIPTGTIEARVGEPIALRLDGRIEGTPIDIGIRTDSLASFAQPKERLNATLDAKLLNAVLSLTGTAPLPVQPQDLRFELELSGEILSDFDELTGVSLPPWGPYRLAGEFGSRASGYYIESLQLGIGGSRLSGALDLDTRQTPPRLDAEFVARSVQLDDFKTGTWSATEKDSNRAEPSETGTNTEESLRTLLSPETMGSLDAAVSIAVDEVISGKDRLGSGVLEATLIGGRLTVEPISVNVPGGNVAVGLAFEPTDSDIGLEARAKIRKLDYGLLARRIDPESTTGGRISLDVDVTARGPDLAEIMGASDGHIDFAVWPKDLEAGVFDLWAVNLFTAVLPSVDSEASEVNCLVARFALEDGLMRPTALLIDTSRIQATGDGKIDFKTNTIEFGASPKSKRPQLFSAQTPIVVEGRFTDFEVGLPPGALVGTVVRMITSPVRTPFEWIFTKNEPADGKVACQQAWSQSPHP